MRAGVGLTENVRASVVDLDIGSAGVNPVLPELEVKMLPRARVTGWIGDWEQLERAEQLTAPAAVLLYYCSCS